MNEKSDKKKGEEYLDWKNKKLERILQIRFIYLFRKIWKFINRRNISARKKKIKSHNIYINTSIPNNRFSLKLLI